MAINLEEALRYGTRISTLILLLLLPVRLPMLFSQTTTQITDSGSTIRASTIYLASGSSEILALGYQRQVGDHFALGIKGDLLVLGGPGFLLPNSGFGGGFKATYYFHPTGYDSFLGLNAVNLEGSYVHPSIDKHPNRDYHAGGLELTVGHDAIKRTGMGLIWALGLAWSSSTDLPDLWLPAIKVGVHVDW